MTRRLRHEERELWDRLRRSVRRLRAAETERIDPAAESAVTERVAPSPAPPRAPAKKSAPKGPSLAPLEERTKRRLARGLSDVEARIDLHGMRQERAHAALLSFLRHAQARGRRIVLVITGKGGPEDTGRGILRQSVPAWLSRPDLRDLVVGFQQAGRRHGGEGAFYVQIRRRRDRAPRPAR